MEVYVSSTFSDVRAYREAAFAALRRLDGIRPIAIEQLSASEALPVDACLAAVRRADAMVLILGHRYGFVPSGYDVSITQLEYEEARRSNKPVLAFLLSEDIPIPVSEIEQDDALRRRLASFRSELLRSLVVAVVRSVEEFQAQLVTAIVNWRREPEVRPTRTPIEQIVVRLESEIAQYAEVIQELQDRLKRVVPATPILARA